MDDKNALFLTKGWGNFLVKKLEFPVFSEPKCSIKRNILGGTKFVGCRSSVQ